MAVQFFHTVLNAHALIRHSSVRLGKYQERSASSVSKGEIFLEMKQICRILPVFFFENHVALYTWVVLLSS